MFIIKKVTWCKKRQTVIIHVRPPLFNAAGTTVLEAKQDQKRKTKSKTEAGLRPVLSLTPRSQTSRLVLGIDVKNVEIKT